MPLYSSTVCIGVVVQTRSSYLEFVLNIFPVTPPIFFDKSYFSEFLVSVHIWTLRSFNLLLSLHFIHVTVQQRGVLLYSDMRSCPVCCDKMQHVSLHRTSLHHTSGVCCVVNRTHRKLFSVCPSSDRRSFSAVKRRAPHYM